MANDDFARGLIPLNTNGHGTVNNHYYRVTTATDLAIGMPVTLAVGFVQRAAVTGMVPCIGAIMGFSFNRGGSNEIRPWLRVSDITAGGGDWYAQVADDPAQEFFIQEDTGGTALTATAPQLTISGLYQTTSIDAISGVARLEIDASTAVLTTGQVFKILRLHDLVNSDGTQNALGDYAKWVVMFAHHQKRGGNIDVP